MCYSQVVLLSEHNKDAKLHSKTAYKLPRGQWIITIDKILEILHKIVLVFQYKPWRHVEDEIAISISYKITW